MIFINVLLLAAGFVGLVKGADFFVDGSASLARKFRIPSLIIGLTIVALGTSAPELAVSVSAALQDANEIALSNVVGSNIFNLLCVLGVCAIIYPVPVEQLMLRRDFPLSIGATVFVLLSASGSALLSGKLLSSSMSDYVGSVSRVAGIILMLCFAAYILYLVYNARKHPAETVEGPDNRSMLKCLVLIVVGLALIVAGGQAVVYSAKEIARAAGMTETLIGLTIVAVGTSLPELVTSIVAAKKGETELALGNVIGSNIFNLMLILGLSSTIHPISVNIASVFDLIILLAVSFLTMVFAAGSKEVSRREGLILVGIYIADLVFAILR